MAFIETPRFPESIGAGSQFGPGYSTSIARNAGGFEVNNQNWSMPLYQGNVIQGVRTQAELDDLLAFFHGVAGMHNGFRFKNFNDYQVVEGQGVLVAIDATHWQLYKKYTFAALQTLRKISKPVTGTVVLTGGGTYSVDSTTGIVTKSAGADPTDWTGEFDFPVRFDIDQMLPQWISFELYDWTSIAIIELRL
jgi:uncharacterized protein (TIGR02217 family)